MNRFGAPAQDMPAAVAGLECEAARRVANYELKGLSFLGHDLNNNLASINLNLAVLGRRLDGRADLADAAAMLDAARQSVEQTVRGIRRPLEYGRLRAPRTSRTRVRPVDARDVATRVVAQHLLQAEAKGIDVVIEMPADAVIDADEDLLVLVLQNLVGNAVKYSDGGRVSVGLGDARPLRGGGWALSVSDAGRGIPPRHLADIFAAFRRGDASAAEQGVGLGLAIAAEAARLMRAELSVASAVGVGSTFLLAPRRRPTHRVGHTRRGFKRGLFSTSI
jgi:signal transduction histidine kinase